MSALAITPSHQQNTHDFADGRKNMNDVLYAFRTPFSKCLARALYVAFSNIIFTTKMNFYFLIYWILFYSIGKVLVHDQLVLDCLDKSLGPSDNKPESILSKFHDEITWLHQGSMS